MAEVFKYRSAHSTDVHACTSTHATVYVNTSNTSNPSSKTEKLKERGKEKVKGGQSHNVSGSY